MLGWWSVLEVKRLQLASLTVPGGAVWPVHAFVVTHHRAPS